MGNGGRPCDSFFLPCSCKNTVIRFGGTLSDGDSSSSLHSASGEGDLERSKSDCGGSTGGTGGNVSFFSTGVGGCSGGAIGGRSFGGTGRSLGGTSGTPAMGVSPTIPFLRGLGARLAGGILSPCCSSVISGIFLGVRRSVSAWATGITGVGETPCPGLCGLGDPGSPLDGL